MRGRRQHIYVHLGPRTYCGQDGSNRRPISITDEEYEAGLADNDANLCQNCVYAVDRAIELRIAASVH